MNVNERIKYIIDFKKLNKNSFSNNIGIQPQTLHHIVGGRLTKPSFEVLEKIISTYSDINPIWLINGKGKPFLTPEVSWQLQESTHNADASNSKRRGNSREQQKYSPEISQEPFCKKSSDSNVNNKEIDLLTENLDNRERVIESLERQITSLQSNMDIIIKAKDELLKSREEMIKQKEEVIATQKQHIKELSRKNNIIDLSNLPATDQTTVEREGNATVLKQVKKISPSHSARDIPRPSGRK